MSETMKEFSQALKVIRAISWKITAKAHAFRELHFEAMADDLYIIAGELDEVADKLMENRQTELSCEWDEARSHAGGILSALLQKSIDEDERANS